MKKYGKIRMEKELVIRISVLFLFGFAIGGILFRGMNLWELDTPAEEKEAYLKALLTQELSLDLFFYVTWEKLKGILIFLCIMMTWLNLPFLYLTVFRQGLLLGYLFICFVCLYHAKGLLLVLGYYFPQALFDIPLWLYCFSIAWKLHKSDDSISEPVNDAQIRSISLHNKIRLHLDGKRVMLIMVLCIAAGTVEATIGTLFLQKILEWILG